MISRYNSCHTDGGKDLTLVDVISRVYNTTRNYTGIRDTPRIRGFCLDDWFLLETCDYGLKSEDRRDRNVKDRMLCVDQDPLAFVW